jgi:hypothetical protein
MASSSTAVSSRVPTTAATTIAPPVLKDSRYTTTDFVLEFLRTKSKDIVKGLGYATFWANFAMPDIHPAVNKFSLQMNHFKNLLSAIEVPDKLVKLHGTAGNLFKQTSEYFSGKAEATKAKVMDAGKQVFKDASSVLNSVTDGFDFGNHFVHINQEAFRWLKGINFTGTLISSGMGFVEQGQKVYSEMMDNTKPTWKDVDWTKVAYYTVSVLTNASYIGVGAVGLWFVLAGTATIPWMIILPLSIGLTCTITSLFMEKILDPEKKGIKNQIPSVVVENAAAQRDYLRAGGAALTAAAAV